MKILFLLLCAVAAWGQQTPSPADPVVLTIGTEKITKSQFEQIISTLSDQQRAQAETEGGRRQIAEQLSELKVLAQAARASKLDQTPKVQMQLKLQAEQILANMEYQSLSTTAKPDDATLRAYYTAHKQEWDEVNARHILIRMKGSQVPIRPDTKDLTDEEAAAKVKDLREKLVAGADFGKLAEAESDDTGTGANGGSLGAFTKGSMVPEFEEVAFKIEPGKVSDPVKTQFGYHLILVDSHKAKAFEDVRGEIEQKIKPEMGQKGLDDLKKKTPVVYNEAYFGK